MKHEVIEQKLVPFGGSEILAVKTKEGKIYGAVRWICIGIGLTVDQAKRQMKNIREDLVISKGYRKLTLPTNGGSQEVFCIELDFLPLWLTKISITPAMQETNPKAVENLVNYQLKVKDVLAEAFLPKVEQDPIILALEAALETRKQVQAVQTDVKYLKDTMRIDGIEQFQLNEAGKKKAIDALGGKDTPAYKELSKKVFAELWGDFKKHFTVPRYSELPKVKYSEGMQFISIWEPNTSMKIEIQKLNAQKSLL